MCIPTQTRVVPVHMQSFGMPAGIKFDPLTVDLPMMQERDERQLGTGLHDVQNFKANCFELLAPAFAAVGFEAIQLACLFKIEVEMERSERT